MLNASKIHVIPHPIAHSTRNEKRQHSDRDDGEATTILFASAFASSFSTNVQPIKLSGHSCKIIAALAARPNRSVQGNVGSGSLHATETRQNLPA